MSEGDSFTPSGEDGTRGLVFRATCRLRRGRHEGVRGAGLPSHRSPEGILSHPRERQHEGL